MGATHFSAMKVGTVSVDPPSIATVSRGSVAVTIAGLAVGDAIILYPPVALNDDLIYHGCRITGANTLTIYLYNPTVGAIDDAAQVWDYVWWDRT